MCVWRCLHAGEGVEKGWVHVGEAVDRDKMADVCVFFDKHGLKRCFLLVCGVLWMRIGIEHAVSVFSPGIFQ